MWDRKETERDRFEPQPAVRNDPPRTAVAPAFHNSRPSHATLGPSLFIKGEVSGSEDLTIEGRVEGRIDLKDHNLTIGPNGRVHAEIHAKNITIVGEVTGNVVADEKVDLTDTGRLVGDIRAPRMAISDGAQFKGSVDMVQSRVEGADKAHGSKEKNVTPAAVHIGHAAQVGKGIQ